VSRFAMTPNRRRAIRDGLVLAGLLGNVALILVGPRNLDLWIDARAWWGIDLANLYALGESSPAAIGFRYAPVVAWLMEPLTRLSWAGVIAVYLALSLLAVSILGRRWTPLLIVAFPPILLELLNGNIHLFMALAIWAGLRWPAAWAFILLTKVTPGAGLIWFVARREWRNLGVALGVTGLIVAVGVAIAPQLWAECAATVGHPSADHPGPRRDGDSVVRRSHRPSLARSGRLHDRHAHSLAPEPGCTHGVLPFVVGPHPMGQTRGAARSRAHRKAGRGRGVRQTRGLPLAGVCEATRLGFRRSAGTSPHRRRPSSRSAARRTPTASIQARPLLARDPPATGLTLVGGPGSDRP
jgi:Glycosyltransferase family 87